MTSVNFMSILKGNTWRDARCTLALRNCGGYAAAVIVRLKALAPYALIELILPGGSVMALLLWLYRRRKSGVGFGRLLAGLLSFPILRHDSSEAGPGRRRTSILLNDKVIQRLTI